MRVARAHPEKSALAVGVLMFAAACATTARYKESTFGPPKPTDTDAVLANLDKSAANAANAEAKQAEGLRIGKELFNDPELGSKGLSCNSCHPGGGTTGGEAEIQKRMGHGPYKLPIPSLIGASARFPKYKVPQDGVITLAQMNNNCVRMFMAGKRLPLDSPESSYLAAYVTSLSDGEEIEVGGGMGSEDERK